MTVLEPSQVRASACDGHNDTLTILTGPYEGLQFRYDVVWLDDKQPEKGIQFHYTCLNGTPNPDDKEDFEHAIAYMLHKQYWTNLETGNLVFSGGTNPEVDAELKQMEEEFKGGTSMEISETSLASSIMQAPGVFMASKEETAMSFLDRLAAQGMAAMKGPK